MAYDRMEPFGDPRADLRAGILAATVVNHSFSPPAQPARPIDFCLFAKRERDDGVLLDDPQAQAELQKRAFFGNLLDKPKG
jgi:hypothetical protein